MADDGAENELYGLEDVIENAFDSERPAKVGPTSDFSTTAS